MNEELGYDQKTQANVLSLYEVGVVIGAIILGGSSDLFYSRRSPIGMISIFFSSLACFVMAFKYQDMTPAGLTAILFVLGFFCGSLHHLICISATADIGRE